MGALVEYASDATWNVYVGGWDGCRFEAQKSIADAKLRNQTLEFNLRKSVRVSSDEPKPGYDVEALKKMMEEIRQQDQQFYYVLHWANTSPNVGTLVIYSRHDGDWQECRSILRNLSDEDKRTGQARQYQLLVVDNGGRKENINALYEMFKEIDAMNRAEASLSQTSCHHTQIADDATNTSNWQWPSPLPMPQPQVDPDPTVPEDLDDKMPPPSAGGCPQWHHLKDGPCRYDYCHCGCEMCQRQCEEGGR